MKDWPSWGLDLRSGQDQWCAPVKELFMRTRRLKHLNDRDLLQRVARLLARDQVNTAELLSALAEVDARRIYVPAGFPSLFAFCVQELHMSEDVAYKRIQAARAVRRFPALLAAVADGRLHLTGAGLLAPHLTVENAEELLQEAAHRTKAEIEHLLARRFPRPDVPAVVRALPDPTQPSGAQPAPAQVGMPVLHSGGTAEVELAPAQVGMPVQQSGGTSPLEPAPAQVGTSAQGVGDRDLRPGPTQVHSSAPRPRLTPIAPERFGMQLTIGKATHDKLRHAQALLSHRIPPGDLPALLDCLLDLAIPQLEKQKFAATDSPRPRPSRGRTNPRHVPAQVKREVWKRDGARCTFVSESGRRCNARQFLEFDHIQPVARGGQASVAGIRLRCRMHNQHEADRIFGTGFMAEKREARPRAAGARSIVADGACSRNGLREHPR